MTSVEPHAPASPGPPTSLNPREFNAWLETIELNEIAVISQSSERTGPGDSDTAEFKVEGAYQVADDGLHYRFAASATMYDEDNTELGAAHVAVFVIIDCPSTPSVEAIEYFGATSVPMMAHPYVREALSTAAARVGFYGITLPRITHQPIKMPER